VILEDDESNTPNPEAAVVSASVDVGADSAFELSKPIDPSGHEAWYDVEDDRFVGEDLRPFPPLEQEDLASTEAQGQPHSRCHSSGPSHDGINQHDDRTSEEPGPHTLPQPLDEVGGGESEENVSEFERDMLLAFEEHVKSSSATAPSSPLPHRHSTEPPHPQIDQEHDQSEANYARLEELRHGSLLRIQDQKEEKEPQEQQRQEIAVDAMREVEDDDGEPERGKRGEKRRRHPPVRRQRLQS
jgi:hypothetical protein